MEIEEGGQTTKIIFLELREAWICHYTCIFRINICCSLYPFVVSLAFQEHLSSNNAKYRKSYRLTATKSNNSSTTLSSSSLHVYMSKQDKHPVNITCNNPDSIIAHMNVLKRTLPLSYALRASLSHVTFILFQNLSSNMSSWNLASLAWLLFKEIPLTRCSVNESMAIAYDAVSPRLSFPAYSGLHSLERSCRTVCSSLHKTYTYFQVCHCVINMGLGQFRGRGGSAKRGFQVTWEGLWYIISFCAGNIRGFL